MKSLAILGKNGQLGSILLNQLESSDNWEVSGFDRSQCDLTDKKSIQTCFKNTNFNHIIIAAAYTQVDLAETEKSLAYKINVQAIKTLTETLMEQEHPPLIVYISTDYVFNGQGTKPYKTDDPIEPINYYGQTKWEGEQVLREHYPNHCIIRTSWVYSTVGHNFFKTMYKLSESRKNLQVVNDQTGCPTYAKDLASWILKLLDKHEEEIQGKTLHLSNQNPTSWFHFAKKIFQLKQWNGQLDSVKSNAFPTVAKRPKYSVLDCSESIDLIGELPSWQDGLERCYKAFLKSQ